MRANRTSSHGRRLAGRWLGSVVLLAIVAWFAVTQLERSLSVIRVGGTLILVAGAVGTVIYRLARRPRWAWVLPGVALVGWMILMITGEMGSPLDSAVILGLTAALAVWAGYSYQKKRV